MEMAPSLDYYQLLDLADRRNAALLSHPEVKAAYRRALLKHHPDKKNATSAHGHVGNATPSASVDDIALAYKTLSDPELRAEYDRWLRNQHFAGSREDVNHERLRTGLETVDLDDLRFDPDRSLWSRGCRCGDEEGFLVSEADLEQNADDSEVIVGCKGCSLWLRVLFGVEP